MRLAFFQTETTLLDYELVSTPLLTSTLFVTDLISNLLQTSQPTGIYSSLFNFFIDPHTNSMASVSTHLNSKNDLAGVASLAWQVWNIDDARVLVTTVPTSYIETLPLNIANIINWNLASIFITLYICLVIWGGIVNTTGYMMQTKVRTIAGINSFLHIWIFASTDKLESTEEAISLVILWPWCFLIVFTHLFSAADHTILFGFSEWGLPVTYGLIMLTEHCWTLGTYTFVYLAGAKGRKISLLIALEDIVALLILIARVLLQAVRGVIVGMFHFISRELLWNMSSYWTTSTIANASISSAPQQMPSNYFVLECLTTGALAGGSFVVITGIMFLQLIFLLVSVWLFCKCWFISWRKC